MAMCLRCTAQEKIVSHVDNRSGYIEEASRRARSYIMSKGQDRSFPLMTGAIYLVSFMGRYA